MRVEGDGNLHTMAPEASARISGTGRVKVYTKAGVWSVEECEDGTLRVRAIEPSDHSVHRGLLAIRPEGGNTVRIEMR